MDISILENLDLGNNNLLNVNLLNGFQVSFYDPTSSIQTQFNNISAAGYITPNLVANNNTTPNDGVFKITNTGDGSNSPEVSILFKAGLVGNGPGFTTGRIYGKWDGINQGDQRTTIQTIGGDGSFLDTLTTKMANVTIGGNVIDGSGSYTLGILNGTEPSVGIANGILISSKDSSDGSANATLSLRLEQSVESIGSFTASHKIKVWINGVEYWLQLDAV